MIGIPHRMICNCNNQGNNQGNNQAPKKVTLYAAVLLSGVTVTKEGKITTKEIVFDPKLPTLQEIELYLPVFDGGVKNVVVWASLPGFRLEGAWKQNYPHQATDLEMLDNPNITGAELLQKLDDTPGVEYMSTAIGTAPEGEWNLYHKDKSAGYGDVIIKYKFTGYLQALQQ